MMHLILFEDYKNEKVGYHVSASKNDKNISEKGIVSEEKEIYRYGVKETLPIQNYFWLDLKYAIWFKEHHENISNSDEAKDMTIWKVDLTRYNLTKDSEAIDMSEWDGQFDIGEDGNAVIVNLNIPPSRITKLY